MKAKILLIAFLSIVVSQSVHADITIIAKNNISLRKNTEIQVCAGENNCTEWVVSSYIMNHHGTVTKVGLASEGFLTIKYQSTNNMISRLVKLPAFLDQYNNIAVILTIEDDKGLVTLRVDGTDYQLFAYSEDV